MEIYKILPCNIVSDWAGRAVEIEIIVISLTKLALIFQPNPLLDFINSVDIESAIYRERSLKIVRESTPQRALRWLSHCWRGWVWKPQEKRFPAIMEDYEGHW